MNLPRPLSPFSPWAQGAHNVPYVGQAISVSPIYVGLSAISSAASAYHGYKRHASKNAIPWAVGWGLLGAAFPVIVPAVALAQGFAKKE